ncbi:MAG: S-layer homology domain-containing protein [Gorillibacterium sp.]|nr:S-layer homology domain-containing protein [Gorillibacterium sp.]
MRNRMAKITAKAALTIALLTGALTVPQAVNAANEEIGTTSPANWAIKASIQFPDIAATHWAAKDIAKMTMLSVISGDNGYFKPNVDVSHQHVLVMAVKMMGLTDEALAENTNTIVFPFGVDNSLKGYVFTAIKHGLISPSEIKAGDTTWGKSAASREWVAQVVVRLANKDAEAKQKMQAPSAFRDGDSVTSPYVGYVNEVFDLGIISGFEDGTFRPLTAVNRAQAAIMLNKAGEMLTPQPGHPSTGTVLSNDGSSLKLMTEAGSTLTVALTQQTLVYNGKQVMAASTLRPGNLIKVIESESIAYFIDVIKEQGPVVASSQGIVASFQANDKKLTITASTTITPYDVIDEAWESIRNVQIGDKVSFQTYGSKIVSAKIIPVFKGELIAIDLKGSNPMITIKKADGKPEAFLFAANVTVSSPIKVNAQLSDLYLGDQLAVELNDAKDAAKIDVVLSAVSTKYMATVQVLVPDTKSLMLTLNDGTVMAYSLDDRTLFTNDSSPDILFTSGLYSLLTKGNRIDLTVSGSRVLKLNFSKLYSGEVKSYNPTSRELVLKLADNTLLPLIIRTSASVIKTDAKIGALTDVIIGKRIQVQVAFQSNEVDQIKLLP